MESFVNSIEVVNHSDDIIGEHPKLGNYILKIDGNEATSNATLIADAVARSNKAYLAYTFLSGANRKKYEKLLEDLSNSYAQDKDEYPKTLVGAHKLRATWTNKSTSSSRERSNNDIAFATDRYEEEKEDSYELVSDDEENVTLTTKGEEILYSKKGEKITCYTCGSNHYANKCPDTKKPAKGATAVTVRSNGSILEGDG
eukprot:13516421-Ditylum_brightwellii.AAC.1